MLGGCSAPPTSNFQHPTSNTQHSTLNTHAAESQTVELLRAGRVSEAYGVAATFAREHPGGEDGAEAQRILGNFYRVVQAPEDALKALETAVTLAPNSGPAWRDLAAACAAFPNAATAGKAIEAAKKAVSLLPNDPDALLTMAGLLARQKSPQTEEFLERALIAAPERAEPPRRLAEWILDNAPADADARRAETLTRQSLAMEPDSPQSLILLGVALLRQKRMAEALSPLKRSAELSPNAPRPASELFRAYRASGNVSEADHWRKEAEKRTAYQSERYQRFAELTTRPGDRALLAKFARLLARHGEIGDATRYRAMAMDAPPDSAAVLNTVAADLRAGGYAKAADVLAARATRARP